MVEPTFRQELQCIREVDHLQYIIAMLVWFLSMETGIQIVAITPSMWLPGWGSGHGHYQNSSSICHLQSQNDPGGEASLACPDHSPICSRNGPKESTTWTYYPMCTVYHVAPAASRDLIYASCCTGICHVDLIEKYLSQN